MIIKGAYLKKVLAKLYKTKEMLPDLEDYDSDLTKKKRPPKKKALSDIILLNVLSDPLKTVRTT